MKFGCSIGEPADVGERVCVFGACLVQISVITAHSPFVVGLFDHDNAGEPNGKPDLSDEVYMEESTSSLTVLCHSSPIFLFFCDIGLAWGKIASLWQIMPRWILDMSDGYQANKFAFQHSTSMMRRCS